MEARELRVYLENLLEKDYKKLIVGKSTKNFSVIEEGKWKLEEKDGDYREESKEVIIQENKTEKFYMIKQRKTYKLFDDKIRFFDIYTPKEVKKINDSWEIVRD